MHMSWEQSRKAFLAALATTMIVLAAALAMLTLAGPADAKPDDRPKHRGYGTHSASPSIAPSTAPSEEPSAGPSTAASPSKSASGRQHDDGGDDDGGRDDHDGGDDGDELPRTGVSGPPTGMLVLSGLSVLLLGAGALWLAAALSRRLEGTRLHAQAAGAVAALRRRPSPRPRR
ncbi:hypothetical protein [Catellatospora sp. NPDC049609]|uniref:hypothetical protein n=1 Tax=Catellatospora sp. NPDC049609 TaxID=3155505 RepID=UPI003415C5D9